MEEHLSKSMWGECVCVQKYVSLSVCQCVCVCVCVSGAVVSGVM